MLKIKEYKIGDLTLRKICFGDGTEQLLVRYNNKTFVYRGDLKRILEKLEEGKVEKDDLEEILVNSYLICGGWDSNPRRD